MPWTSTFCNRDFILDQLKNCAAEMTCATSSYVTVWHVGQWDNLFTGSAKLLTYVCCRSVSNDLQFSTVHGLTQCQSLGVMYDLSGGYGREIESHLDCVPRNMCVGRRLGSEGSSRRTRRWRMEWGPQRRMARQIVGIPFIASSVILKVRLKFLDWDNRNWWMMSSNCPKAAMRCLMYK